MSKDQQTTENQAKPLLKITREEWKKTHRDFKSIIDGQRYMMRLVDGKTCLVPVEVVKAL